MPITARVQDGVGILCLDRPHRANAYDRAHLDALDRALDDLVGAGARALLIEAAGDRAFCGGADLDELAQHGPLDALDLRSQQVFDRIARCPLVSVAAVHGPAVAGGCELALACDLRVVGPQARFSLPETALGLIPSAGGTTRLTALVGPSVARQVILAGRVLDATQAVALGLAMELAPDPRARGRELAAQVATRDPLALRLAKEIIAGDPAASLRAERLAEALLYTRRPATADKG